VIEPKSVIRCAVYTRKSSEEGLEQSFNSLDAQREACEAFIASQKQEGWRLLPARYDDGGYSGGNTDRPGLKRLLEDVEKHLLDTIVVYKVDRLTRSLSDFAKIVEAFDAHGVSFVSVTQQFNTTTSMGRLTLNILLSFAQFEREVTGERIRDKIAASKRKGMWMGGNVPLGYDRSQGKLVINPEESERVRLMFNLYLELGCVSKLKDRLIDLQVRSKARVSKTGKRFGGVCYSRGALYQLLKNPTYIGEIQHRDQQYPGEHQAILSRETWDKVQTQLRSTNQGRRTGLEASSTSLLTGLLRNEHGKRFTPSHTLKNGKRYRYYVWRRIATNPNRRTPTTPIRLPAHDIELQVQRRLRAFLSSSTQVMDYVGRGDEGPAVVHELVSAGARLAHKLPTLSPEEQRAILRKILKQVVVHPNKVELLVSRVAVRMLLTSEDNGVLSTKPSEPEGALQDDILRLELQAEIRRQGLAMRLMVSPDSSMTPISRPVAPLLKAIARAHDWSKRLLDKSAVSQTELARQLGLNRRYVDRVLECAFLAPDIVEAILEGRQPHDLTFDKLTRNLPLGWPEQRQQLGFGTPRAGR
jgi:DNA invertase Pin-like site-specific DNA recombinase